MDFSGIIANAAFAPLVKVAPKRCVKCVAVGRQRVVKFRSKPSDGGQVPAKGDDVIILMCVVRLLDVLTDVLITLNVPVPTEFSAGDDAVPPLPPAAKAAASSGNGNRPVSGTDRASADSKAQAATVAALLYKEPTASMLMRAVSLEDRAAEAAPAAPAAPFKAAVCSAESSGIGSGSGSGNGSGGAEGEGEKGPTDTPAVATHPGAVGSPEERQLLSVGRSLKLYQALFHAPTPPTIRSSKDDISIEAATAATDTTTATTEAAVATATDPHPPMYPHAVFRTALENFAIHNWQLFA